MAYSAWSFVVLFSLAACSSDKESANTSSDAGHPCATSTSTFLQCTVCCESPNFIVFKQEIADRCVCDEACKTECASACRTVSPTAPSAECDTCRNSQPTGELCSSKIKAACEADPACAKADACEIAAACDDKPE